LNSGPLTQTRSAANVRVCSVLFILASATGAFGGVAGLARADSVPTSELSAAQIVSRNEQARGGLSAWRKVQTLGYSGQMRVPPPAGGARSSRAERGKLDPIAIPFILALRRPNSSRLEIVYRGEPVVKIFDGKDGWMLRSMEDKWVAVPVPAAMAQAEAEQGSIDGPLIDAQAKGHQVSVEGVDSLDGKPAYRLAVSLASGAIQHVWIDKSSFLDVKMDAVREINGRAIPVAIWFGDYRASDELMIARRIETRALDGTPVETQIIDSVAINPAIEAARFQKPPATSPTSAKPIKP
jgi:hypothetical protein